MKRTTVLLDDELLVLLDRLARQQGVTKARILRQALKAYAEQASLPRAALPSFTGCGASAHGGSLGRDAETLLERKTRRKGWE